MRPEDIPQQNHGLHETRWCLLNCHRAANRDELRSLLDRVLDEYEAMDWLVKHLMELLARHTRPGEDPLVDRLLRAYAGPSAN
ncbi:hypothetical protein [Gandjariella thermophila]|uniref:Uncharacterized protein n=1 Tax=Gandjariella thermophila TaxID=1931992 RepID=A0A4D4JAK9_9PSEU|nr:hypothetical protein [Gandjariella thermophila]GDY31439.1 hypothetical protein GTS_30720 [Gandjariella thermophila]